MALVVPYESREGIRNAGYTGPVARQRSADEFLSLNDKMLAPALRDLSQGMGQLGQILHEEQVRKNQELLELDMINDLQAFRASSHKYMYDYQQAHQGRDAINAEQDFLAWNKEQAEALKKKYAGNAWAMKQLAQHGGNISVSGVNSMRDYSNGEMNAYRNQTLMGLQAQLSSQITADPGNWNRYADQMAGNFAAMNPGAAPELLAAKRDEFRAAGLATAFDAAVASGNMDLARSIMEQAYTARPSADSDGTGLTGGVVGGRPANVPKGAEPYLGIFKKASTTYDVPANIIMAVTQTESGFRAGAVSPTGVKGLMQVTQATYKGLGFTGDRSDPENSVMAGTKLLGQLYKQYGNWEHAFAAYNGGPDAVRGLKTGNWGVWAGNAAKQREIKNYAPTVMRCLRAMGEAPDQAEPTAQGGSERPVDPSLATGEPVMVASLGAGFPAGVIQTDAVPVAGEGQADNHGGSEFIDDPLASADAEGRPPETQSPEAQAQQSASSSLQYGGLVPRDVLTKMEKSFLGARESQINDEHQAAVAFIYDAALNNQLTPEMIYNNSNFSSEEKLGWLKELYEGTGKIGFMTKLKKDEKERGLFVAMELGDIPPTRAGLEHWFKENDAWGSFDHKDFEKYWERMEKGESRLGQSINQFMVLHSSEFPGNKDKAAIEKEKFRIKALEALHEFRLTADAEPEKIAELLTKVLDNYKKNGPAADYLTGRYTNRGEVLEELAVNRLRRSGFPPTDANLKRARQAVEKGVPVYEIPATDANQWSGKGAMNKTITLNPMVKAQKEHFEIAGNSWNVDPNLLASLAQAATGVNQWEKLTSADVTNAMAKLLPPDAISPTDPREAIHALAEHMEGYLDEFDGDIEASLSSCFARFGDEEKARFVKEVLRIYNFRMGA